MDSPRVAVLTNFPSPYQVEFFDRIAQSNGFQLGVMYRHRSRPGRLWTRPNPIHEHLFVDDGRQARATANEWISSADLVVFGWYADIVSHVLIRERAQTGRPWCFWGERPGFRGLGALGKLFRRVAIGALRDRRVPIWGIGEWAIAGWKNEFGTERRYFNIPYYSDLGRFAANGGTVRDGGGSRRILFSGSLIRRKGVDLLASAFARIATDHANVELIWLGEGEEEASLRKSLQVFGDRVRFLGFQSWDDLPRYYRDADLLCAPSRYDGWGLVVPEALATGMPVISTERSGSALDLISPSINGWRVEAGSSAALEAALREAVNLGEDGYRRMSRAASASVANHSLDCGVERFGIAVEESMTAFDSSAA